MEEFIIRPDPADPRLTQRVTGIDQTGAPIETSVTVERPLTLFLNGQEIVTMMTICDYPEYLALGYLLNQDMLRPTTRVTDIDYDDELETVVVRTERADRLRGEAEEEDADLGLRPGHRLRRPDGEVRGLRLSPTARMQDILALRADPQDQHRAEPLSGGRRHPWLRAVPGGPAAGLYGGCRPAQRGGQDRRLHVAATASRRTTRSSTRRAG